MSKKDLEQTLVLIKPDALKNSLTGYLLSTLSEFHSGLHFSGAKILHVHKMLAEEHYAEHKGKVFYPALLDYIMGRIHYAGEPWKQRVIAIVYQGRDAAKKIRAIAGPTNPLDARVEKPGSIRALGTLVPIKNEKGKVIAERIDNIIHASATNEEAEREIKLWFKPNEIPPLMHAYPTEISQKFYYFKDGKLLLDREPGSICVVAPDDMAWKSDLKTLRLLSQGKKASQTLASVIAKYLINENRFDYLDG